jgi:hypothetical protein
MNIDLKELLTKPYEEQRRRVANILGHQSSCILFNAVMTHQQAHVTVVDVALLRQLRHLVDIKTAVDYHNRSETVTQRIMTRPDSVEIWTEIYNQYIPNIAAQTTAGDATGAWNLIMTMLVKVESQY